ncbi:MAG TPA: alpha/beta fold hydrolase [Candidatus Methylacidiphilales bacterium]|jgi:pimeloyl-ACP methyl ester carboxylesterase|nr:alpha/beta fold hydrolase [Candidatus Methylacidiphilales bacterium]
MRFHLLFISMAAIKILVASTGFIFVLFCWYILSFFASPASSNPEVTINLKRDKLTVVEYPSQQSQTKAIILFGSGDGGWNSLERAVARALQAHGYDVIGIDSAKYATSDYDLDTLQSDFASLAQIAEKPFAANPRPLIVGGYSMGAAQAVAVAGGPHPPPHLVGVLLMDPLSRGRYGLRTEDQMNVLPSGAGTFAVADFASKIKNARVVQWHAANDTIDSRAWLTSLTVPYKELDQPGAGHTYDVGRDAFLVQLVASADWILGTPAKSVAAADGKG